MNHGDLVQRLFDIRDKQRLWYQNAISEAHPLSTLANDHTFTDVQAALFQEILLALPSERAWNRLAESQKEQFLEGVAQTLMEGRVSRYLTTVLQPP